MRGLEGVSVNPRAARMSSNEHPAKHLASTLPPVPSLMDRLGLSSRWAGHCQFLPTVREPWSSRACIQSWYVAAIGY